MFGEKISMSSSFKRLEKIVNHLNPEFMAELNGVHVLWSILPNGIGLVKLNRSKQLNALTFAMFQSIYHIITHFEANPNVHLIVFQSTSKRAFCSGGDLNELANSVRGTQSLNFTPREFCAFEYKLDHLIATIHTPVLSLIDGIVMGGGAGLCMNGTFRIVTEQCQFAMPEVQIGFVPDVGSSFWLNKCPEGVGMFLALTGQTIQGMDLLHCGLAHAMTKVPFRLDDLRQLSLDSNVSATKQKVHAWIQSHEMSHLKSILDLKWIATHFGSHQKSLDTIRQTLTLSANNGDLFAQQSLNSLNHAFSKSLTFAYTLQRQGAKDRNLIRCFQRELDAACKVMSSGDFERGVARTLRRGKPTT